MAYAFGFPKDVTDRMYSMRDWRLEEVKEKGGTKLSREIWVSHRPPPPFYFNNYDLAERERKRLVETYEEPNWRLTWQPSGVGFWKYDGVGFFQYANGEAHIGRHRIPYTFASYTESKNKKLNIRACCKDLSRPVDHFVCQPCDDEESRIMMRRINAQ